MRTGPRFVDDAFITFRYARNVAEGTGLVYNAGESILGTSSPAFAVLLAGLHRATGTPIPVLAFGLGAACLPLVALVGFRVARRAMGVLFATLFVASALSPRESLRVFSYGMETPLYLLGLLAAVELVCRGWTAAGFFVAGGLAFVHPDAVLLVPALAIALRFATGAWPVRAAAVGLLPAAAAIAAAYGSPIPQSVKAKYAVHLVDPGSAAAELSDSVFLVAALRGAPPLAGGRWQAAADLAAPAAAAVLTIVTFVKARMSLAPLPVLACALFSASYLVAFALGNPLVFPWYRPPLTLAAALVVCAAAGGLPRAGRVTWTVLLAGTAVLLAATFVPYDPSGREDVYREAVEALAPGPRDLVAAPEFGAIGWYSRARIVDTIGLVSPEALRNPSLPDGSISADFLRATPATALVTLGRFLAAAKGRDPGALERWHLEARYPASAFGDTEVLVYRRVGGRGS